MLVMMVTDFVVYRFSGLVIVVFLLQADLRPLITVGFFVMSQIIYLLTGAPVHQGM